MPVIKQISSSATLPKQAAVCVIGGGVAGVTTALELAERGIDVVVLEKGEIAAEQSSRNWGWCRQMGRDAREIPLIQVSLALWDGMNARVQGETGFTRCGILYLCETDEQLAAKAAAQICGGNLHLRSLAPHCLGHICAQRTRRPTLRCCALVSSPSLARRRSAFLALAPTGSSNQSRSRAPPSAAPIRPKMRAAQRRCRPMRSRAPRT